MKTASGVVRIEALDGFALGATHFAAAASEREHIEPRHHGLTRIGHFGFFRPAARSLWPLALDWLGRHSRRAQPAPAQPAGAYA